ncbi:FAD-binding oxidoreductase [Geoalkalibacter halelectricus]|uniref:FAD-binding oxidoreductase n=1 Tax=Geoalkalibacter halelectricus TaxID=2847045 RepID=UPI003D25EC34
MSEIQILTRRGTVVNLQLEILDNFKNQFRGTLLKHGDEEYDQARKVWNGTIDKRPALIARCRGAADVMAVVNFAREHQLAISIRSGGHNVSGAAISEQGLVIDLSHMRSVQVNPRERVARAEGGALLGDLDHETTAFGLAAPVGVVSETGVAGLTLHGGTGWLMRKHGLTIDNLLAVEIVTSDGRLLRASADEHPDLFWALRGGGGNFGVATAFEYRLHPIPESITFAMPIYSLEVAAQVIAGCRDYMHDAPEELMVLGTYWSAPPIANIPEEHHGKPVVILLGCYSGPAENAENVTGPLRSLAEPIADLTSAMSWKDLQRLLDEDYPNGKYYYWKSIYLDRLDEAVMAVMEEYARSRPSPETSIDIWHMGGAMSRVEPTATAFFNRRIPFMVAIEANWSERADSDANIAWARALHKALQPFSSGGNYLNFPGYVEEQDAMLRGAYGDNLTRLKQIKAKYDPDNLFPGLLNIKPG